MNESCANADVPWARSRGARALREVVLIDVLGPTMDLYTRRRVRRTEHIEALDAP